MPSRRELVLQAVVAALDGAGKPPGLTVHRSRTRPIDKDDLPAIVVYQLTDVESEAYATGAVQREVTVGVETRVQGNPPDQVLDPYTSWAVQALMADPTLGGAALKIDEGQATFDADESDKIYGQAGQAFIVTYRRARNDPDQPA